MDANESLAHFFPELPRHLKMHIVFLCLRLRFQCGESLCRMRFNRRAARQPSNNIALSCCRIVIKAMRPSPLSLRSKKQNRFSRVPTGLYRLSPRRLSQSLAPRARPAMSFLCRQAASVLQRSVTLLRKQKTGKSTQLCKLLLHWCSPNR
jgi:hypothetical protein